MNGLLESASTKAARLGAVDITAAFVKENLHHLSIVLRLRLSLRYNKTRLFTETRKAGSITSS